MNIVTLQRTRFTNLHVVAQLGSLLLSDEPKEKNESFGFRLYDDEDAVYNNTLATSDLVYSDEDFIRLVSESLGIASEMIDYVMEYGIRIDDTWYDAAWVRKAIDLPGEEINLKPGWTDPVPIQKISQEEADRLRWNNYETCSYGCEVPYCSEYSEGGGSSRGAE